MWKVTEVKRHDDGRPYWIDCKWHENGDEWVWATASLKWDGCVHFNQIFNVPRQDSEPCRIVEVPRDLGDKNRGEDYLHICSLRETINQFSALRAIGVQHFGEDWDK